MKIQNFLPPILEKDLYDNLTNSHFPWYWNDVVNYEDRKENLFQFTHHFIKNGKINSDYINLAMPIIYLFEKEMNINIKYIDRLKANLTTKTMVSENDIKELYHKDMDSSDYISFIYYVNDSDGDTIIENKFFTPERNSLIYFKSNIFHAGMFPQINKRRIIINAILQI